MLIKQTPDVPESEVTPREHFLNRRRFLAGTTMAGLSLGAGAYLFGKSKNSQAEGLQKLVAPGTPSFRSTRSRTPTKT